MADSDFESLIQRIGRDPLARIVHGNVVQCVPGDGWGSGDQGPSCVANQHAASPV